MGIDEIKRSYLIIPDALRKPIILRDVVFNGRRATDISQLQGKSKEHDNWNYFQKDESETEAMDASQPKLSDVRDKCNNKR